MSSTARFFGPAERPCLGWLHPAAGAPAIGVVICAPLGQEMPNSYRTQQALARALSDAGSPVLRFDYPGCGDSAEGAHDPDTSAVGAWESSIETAIDHLVACTGVRQIVLLALRAGALLAAPVALRRADVMGFVAIAPHIAGRAMLREWRALEATQALRATRDDGALEVSGAVHAAATCQDLQSRSLTDLAWPAGKPVLVIERDDLPSAGKWLERLRKDGCALSHLAHAGLDTMLLEPHRQRVPLLTVQTVVEWIRARQAQAHAAAPIAAAARYSAGSPPAGAADPIVSPGMPHARDLAAGDALAVAEPTGAIVADGVRERPLLLAERELPLFSIVSEPVSPRPGMATVVMVNTGGVHHIGGHRLYVRLARELAARGHRAVRLDLSGLGDSPARERECPDVVYGRRAVDDLSLVLRELRARWPDSQPQFMGLCAGAYHSLRLAVAQGGAAQCLIVNPLVYHWHEGMTLDGMEGEVQAAYYRGKWRRWKSWSRLFSGRSDWRALRTVLAHHAQQAWTQLAQRARAGTAEPDDLARDLQGATGRGTRLRFLFSPGEPGWPALQQQAAEVLPGLLASGKVTVDHLPGADHTMSIEAARRDFIAWACTVVGDAAGRVAPSPVRARETASQAR